MKKAQASLFVIVALILVVGIVFLVSANHAEQSSTLSEENYDDILKSEVTSLNIHVESCLDQSIKKAVNKVGTDSESILKSYISLYTDQCVEQYTATPGVELNYSSIATDLEIYEDNIAVKQDLELMLSKDGQSKQLKTFNTNFPLKSKIELKVENNVVKQDAIIKSPDGQIKITIKAGTQLNQNVQEITVKTSNSLESGGTTFSPLGYFVYELEPHGLTFNPPLEAEIEYNEAILPASVDESTLSLSFLFDGFKGRSEWLNYKSSVDTANNIITAQINHFTNVTVTSSDLTEGSCGSGSKLVHTETSWCTMDCTTNTPCAAGEINCDCYSGCGGGDVDRCIAQANGDDSDGATIDGYDVGDGVSISGGSSGKIPGFQDFRKGSTGPYAGDAIFMMCPNTKYDKCYLEGKSGSPHSDCQRQFFHFNGKRPSGEMVCVKNGEEYIQTFSGEKGGSDCSKSSKGTCS